MISIFAVHVIGNLTHPVSHWNIINKPGTNHKISISWLIKIKTALAVLALNVGKKTVYDHVIKGWITKPKHKGIELSLHRQIPKFCHL